MKLILLWESNLQKSYELYSSFEKDENGFINDAYGYSFEEFKEFVKTRKNNSLGINLPENHVPDSVYILVDEDNYIGIFKLRHYLNDALKQGAGHIGYGISSKYRGQGYATRGLSLMIELASTIIPEDEIYLSVHKDNIASLKVQMKNGASIHHENEEEYCTRIQKNKRSAS